MNHTDEATSVRPGKDLALARLHPYLQAHIPGLEGSPRVTQFPGGASNLTYLIRYDNRD